MNRTTEMFDSRIAKQMGQSSLWGHLLTSQYNEKQNVNPGMYVSLIKSSGWIVLQSFQARTRIKLSVHCEQFRVINWYLIISWIYISLT